MGPLARREHAVAIEGSLGADTRTRLDRLVDSYLRAETEGDVETILSLLTRDIEYEVLGGGDPSARGHDAVRASYQQQFANLAHDRNVPLRRLYGDGFVVDEQTWEGRVIGRLGPFAGAGKRTSHRALHVFELRGDQIARLSLYRDHVAIMQQLS
jgi:steroid delta-isomerase-like uncharacterized protein